MRALLATILCWLDGGAAPVPAHDTARTLEAAHRASLLRP
jgi:hypothetical protein